ncbi:MAG TPA: membrane dipeptidase, partial [Nannocystis sp.]
MLTGIGVIAPANLARAEKSADQVCEDLAKKAKRTLWNSVRETGDELFCRKSWVPGRADELLACGVWTQTNLFANKLKGAWNRFFAKADAEWATWGPRGIGPEWESGTIRLGFKRTFFGAALAHFTSTVEVEKTGGSAEAHVTVCELDYDGKVVGAHRRSFASGSKIPKKPEKISITPKNNVILGVVVDTPASVNAFEYRARVSHAPPRNNLPPVKGIADLHVHQLMNLAFAGRMYWGQHAGPKSTALAKEVLYNELGPITITTLDQLKALAADFKAGKISFDGNILLKLLNDATSPAVSDQGFFQLGGEGWPSFRDWPHHADRSHQQVHIDWVREAHERGKDTGSNLALMVVSLVNNDVLCTALKAVDKYGNVPTYDNKGNIKGWESAPWGCSDHENVTRQFAALHQLERDYPWYRIAMSPWHARQIIADGDLAVVVSMETDKPLSGPDGSSGEWEKQLDFYRALGLSTLQIVHESDSRFAGAAQHRVSMMKWLQIAHHPLQAIANIGTGSPFELDGKGFNKLALTAEGNRLIDAMVRRNMPIDIAHLSMRARQAVFQRVPKDYGLYDSHTKFEKLLPPEGLDREKEFVILDSLLPLYRKHKVLVGLRTASVPVHSAPKATVPNDCQGSALSFAQLVQYASDEGLDIAYGTDFNTGVSQLGPRFGPKRCFPKTPASSGGDEKLPPRAATIQPIDGTNYYYDGLAHIGWLPELTEDLIYLKTPGATKLRDSAEAYLKMWERAFPARPPAVPSGPPGTIELGGTCKVDADCKSGSCTGALGVYGVCVCNDDDDCADNQFCDAGLDFKQNKCVALKSDGAACAIVGGNHQCASGHCGAGRCYTPNSVALGGTCYVDAACRVGKCSSVDGTKGTCVCKADADCGAGRYCDAGLDFHQNKCFAL